MLVNPSSLYGGNAFKIDMQPAVNYFLKRQAQEQAKEKTLENYFTNLDEFYSQSSVYMFAIGTPLDCKEWLKNLIIIGGPEMK